MKELTKDKIHYFILFIMGMALSITSLYELLQIPSYEISYEVLILLFAFVLVVITTSNIFWDLKVLYGFIEFEEVENE